MGFWSTLPYQILPELLSYFFVWIFYFFSNFWGTDVTLPNAHINYTAGRHYEVRQVISRVVLYSLAIKRIWLWKRQRSSKISSQIMTINFIQIALFVVWLVMIPEHKAIIHNNTKQSFVIFTSHGFKKWQILYGRGRGGHQYFNQTHLLK